MAYPVKVIAKKVILCPDIIVVLFRDFIQLMTVLTQNDDLIRLRRKKEWQTLEIMMKWLVTSHLIMTYNDFKGIWLGLKV